MIGMRVADKKTRGRPKRRFVGTIEEDMKVGGVNEKDAMDREKWREVICRGDPKREGPKEEEEL